MTAMAKKIRIGVFIPNRAQALDTACADMLGIMSKEFLATIPPPLLPSFVIDVAPHVDMFYITSPGQGPEIPLSSGMTLKATHDYTDPEVAPGNLDIVVIPGPELTVKFEEGTLDWLRRQFNTPGVDILSICSAMFMCGEAGIADGKTVAGTRSLQGMFKKRFPNVNFVGDKYRWVQDGNLWSSGGVVNGNDLMAAYTRACNRWPQSIVEAGISIAEVEYRDQAYESRQTTYMLGLAWKMLRVWCASFWSANKKADKTS
ncbi:hypothetical protein HIM_09092 [Hirsutella minnesotensis 3608]|uniref:DJ-1/PfpI domain-containing protein n=1 Tax=Hirsutella minnesotensis 3608 TaxID=1043627 RepID=A0A0F8A3A8_9HYPO|nr:hypothetical protein HIM_09092 [Hirsutella minnesotensis 3608]